jgi:hypothetical protein
MAPAPASRLRAGYLVLDLATATAPRFAGLGAWTSPPHGYWTSRVM